jgi:hypothetical protein
VASRRRFGVADELLPFCLARLFVEAQDQPTLLVIVFGRADIAVRADAQ